MPTKSRWRMRLATLTALVTGVGVVAVPGAAHAENFGPRIPCPTDPNIVWTKRIAQPHIVVYEGYIYAVSTATRIFSVSDGRVVDNTLDSPIEATFTSQQSRTYTITVTEGSTSQLVNDLQRTVSVSIVASRTTSIGINATVTVPAHTRVVGEYGLEAYDISYTAQRVWMLLSKTKCYHQGTAGANTIAPTVLEGWRFSAS